MARIDIEAAAAPAAVSSAGPSWWPGGTAQIFIGLAVGVAIGALAPDVAVAIKPLADAFLRMIKMIVAPLLFSTLVVGIAGTGDMKAMGRIGLKALIYFEVATTIALFLGLGLVNAFQPGAGVSTAGTATTDVAAYYEGKVQHVSILPYGGATLTADLVRGLSIPFGEAHRIKEHFGVALAQLVDPRETVPLPGPAPGQTRRVSRELIAHVLEQRLDELFGIVQGELQGQGLMGQLGAGIVLTGGTAAMPGVVDLAQQGFNQPVRLGVPSEGLSGIADSVRRPRFAVAAGLALWGADRFGETGKGASTVTSGVFTKLAAVGALNPAFFRAGPAALDGNDYIVYNKLTGVLFYDSNGNGAGGAVQIAVLTNKPVLTASDFFVI